MLGWVGQEGARQVGGEEREGNIGEGDLSRMVVENAAWDLKTYTQV